MKTKIFLFLLAAVTGNLNSYSQAPKLPVSPEAASLAKMVNYPVNLNTGVPNISIPLYEIEAGGMTLPIALNYHAGGFKTNERSTSVGLGFSLTCDIQISRSVNGLDDFKPGSGYIANTMMKAHYPDYLDCTTCPYPLNIPNPFLGRNQYDIAVGNVDGMPDKFNYKLLNKSGSFYFQKNDAGTGYTIVPVPFDNIMISYNNGEFTIIDTDGSRYIFGGPPPYTSSTMPEKRVEFSHSGTVSSLSAWKCRTITNPTETDSIKFTYQAKTELIYKSRSESIEYYTNEDPCGLRTYHTSDIISGSITTYQSLLLNYPFYSLSSPKYMEHFSDRPSVFHLPYLNTSNAVVDRSYVSDQPISYNSSSVTALALSKIEFRGGSVLFSGTDQLASIKIQDAANTEIKSFAFFQSFKSPIYVPEAKNVNGVNFNGTMYLDSIHVKNSGTVYERYKLLYKDKYCFGEHLKGKDAWGYPNSSTMERYGGSSGISIPFKEVSQLFFKNIIGNCMNFVSNVIFGIGNPENKETPARDPAQSGILQRIVYPTGGFVDFDFESNKFRNQTTDSNFLTVRMGGGLRIRSINYYDGKSMTPVNQKYYRYGNMEDGIGVLINSPADYFEDVYDLYNRNYNAYSFSQTTVYLTGPPNPNFGNNFDPIPANCTNRSCLHVNSKEKKTTYMPASAVDYTYSNGASIYYTKVTEYNSDLGMNTGKKVHTFYEPNHFDAYSFYSTSKIPETNIDVLQTDGLMGEQKLLEEYKFEKGKYSLVHSKEFTYTKYLRPQQVNVVYSYLNTVYSIIGGSYGSPSETNANYSMSLYDSSYDFAGGYSDDEYKSGEYGIQVGKLLLTAENEKWLKDSDTLSQFTEYKYDNAQYVQPSRVLVTNSNSEQITRTLKYSYDFNGTSVYDQMKAKNMISQPVEEIVHNTSLNKEISRTKTNYAEIVEGFGFIAPKSMVKSVGGRTPDTLVTFVRKQISCN